MSSLKIHTTSHTCMHRVKAVQRPETGPPHHPATTQHGLSSPHGAPPPSSDQALRGQWGGAFQGPILSGGLYKAHQDKVMPGILSKSLPAPSAPPPSATGSFTQHSRSAGFVPRPVRKARSETDLRESDFEKQIKVSCICASQRCWLCQSLFHTVPQDFMHKLLSRQYFVWCGIQGIRSTV